MRGKGREGEMLKLAERVGFICLWVAIITQIGVLFGLFVYAAHGAIGEIRAAIGI